MGHRTKQPKPRSPWIAITLIVSPLLLFVGLIAFLITHGGGPDMERGRAAHRQQVEREQAVADVAARYGASYDPSAAAAVITLPQAVAMEITPRQAKEMALNASSSLGKSVRVQTPAGQILAEAP